jgi:hypothetical protein
METIETVLILVSDVPKLLETKRTLASAYDGKAAARG